MNISVSLAYIKFKDSLQNLYLKCWDYSSLWFYSISLKQIWKWSSSDPNRLNSQSSRETRTLPCFHY